MLTRGFLPNDPSSTQKTCSTLNLFIKIQIIHVDSSDISHIRGADTYNFYGE